MQFNTGPTGVDTVTFVAPDPAGPVTVTGTLSGARKGLAKVQVEVKDLMKLPIDPKYDTTGAKPVHPDNHYATQSHIGAVIALANEFWYQFGKKLTFNDSSLELGGLYDVDLGAGGGGYWTYPHRGHRLGQNTDVRTNGLVQEELDFVWDTWEKYGGTVGDETNTSQPHYHLTR